ncbi:MAG: FecR domain-containing protein [Hyphomicrobiales bacterium]
MAVAVVAASAWLSAPERAAALDAIGTAVLVEGDVSGSFSGHSSPLAKGDGVVSREIVRTQAASDGQIVFVDQTKLFVGPLSTVTLDNFAFDQSGAASRFTVGVSKGALRFISGRSDHRAYDVTTPFGSLGVRGTIVDVVVQRARVVVTDQPGANQGIVVVTARNGQSVTLAPGQSAILTSAGVTGPVGQQASALPDFATACGGGCVTLFTYGGPLGIARSDAARPGNGPAGSSTGGNNSGGQSSSSGNSNGSSFSDVRVKRDIAAVGLLPGGIHLYRFRYLWSDDEYVGVMAQEVQRVRPDAVSEGTDGYLRVNYGRLGLRLMPLSEWVERGETPSL